MNQLIHIIMSITYIINNYYRWRFKNVCNNFVLFPSNYSMSDVVQILHDNVTKDYKYMIGDLPYKISNTILHNLTGGPHSTNCYVDYSSVFCPIKTNFNYYPYGFNKL